MKHVYDAYLKSYSIHFKHANTIHCLVTRFH